MSEPIYTSTTFDLPPGYTMTRSIGTCWGIMLNSIGLARGVVGGFKALRAGEVPEYTATVDQARHIAFDRMMEHARAMGGNAVLGVRFDSVKAAGGKSNGQDNGPEIVEILSYGTAVVAQSATLQPPAGEEPPTNVN